MKMTLRPPLPASNTCGLMILVLLVRLAGPVVSARPVKAATMEMIGVAAPSSGATHDPATAMLASSQASAHAVVGTLASWQDPVYQGYLPAAAIATGDEHTCALTTDGSVQCWGAKSPSQLGTDSGWTPVHVVGFSNLRSWFPLLLHNGRS